MNGPPPDAAREPIEAMLLADAIHGRIRRLDVVVPLQVPDDANRAHVIGPAKVRDLIDHLVGRLVRMIVRALPATCEPGFVELPVSVSPQVERRSRDAEAPACRVDVAVLLGVLEDSLLTLDLSLIFGHLDPLGHPPSSS
jgi:hypothetical protein